MEERVNYIYILGIIQNVVWSDQVYTHLMVIIKCLVVLSYGWELIKNLFNSGTIQTLPYQPKTTYSLLHVAMNQTYFKAIKLNRTLLLQRFSTPFMIDR